MKPFSSSVCRGVLPSLVLLGALLLPLSQGHADTVRTPQSAIGQVAGKLILRFDAGTSTQEKNRILAQVGGVVKHTYSTGWMSVQVPQSKTAVALKSLGANAKVAGVEPNYRWRGSKVTPSDSSQLPALRQSQASGSGPVPNDPLYTSQWSLQKIGAPQAWKTTTGSNDVIIGIMDSGVKVDYPDLKANIWTNPGEIPGNGKDDDKNGFVDDVHGWDGLEHDNVPQDEYGHGTLCSSLMAASGNNGKLMTGVNWRIKIVPIRFLSGDNTTTSEAILECFDYIIALRKSGVNLRAVNCSFGAPLNDFTRPFVDSFNAAAKSGALMVVAAGNDNANRDESLGWPTSINVPNSIKVAASDYYDNKADFADYGLKTVNIFAPGKSILAAYIFSTSSQVSSFDGASLSAPLVTGAIGLLCARDPSLTAPQIKQRLFASATHVEQLRLYVKDGLRLNVGALLDNAVHTITGTTTTLSSQSTRPVSVAGISIYLDKTSGTPDAVTDSRGRYTIYGVKGGAHTVRAVLGTKSFGTTTKVNLPTSKNAVPTRATADFVAQTPPSKLYFIAGKVIQNLPRLQTQPKANADIYLNDNPIPYTRSNAQGVWKIPNLPVGAYAVKVVDSVTGEKAPVVEVVTLPSPDPRSIYNPNSPSGYVETYFPYGDRIAPSFGTYNITDFQIYTSATAPQRFTGTLVDNTGVGLANFQLYRVKDDVLTCYDWNAGQWNPLDGDAPELRIEGNGSATLNFDVALPKLEDGYTYYIDTNAPDVFGNLFSYELTFTVEDSSTSTKSSPKATKPRPSAPTS